MRKQAIYGLLFCFVVLGGTLYIDALRGGLVCVLCHVMPIFLAAYMGILLIVAIQHPRKWGCKFYAFLLLIISSIGLFISAAHSHFQPVPSAANEVCTDPSLMAFQNLPYINKVFYLLQNKQDCIEAPLIYGISTSYFITLITLCLFLFSLYLLFRRVERNIFS